MDSSSDTHKKEKENESPLEPKYLIPIKENRNSCYDNISVNIDRCMPGHPLEKEIEEQKSRELTEQAADREDYESHLPSNLSAGPNEGPFEPAYLLPIKENRNNCYDNIWANIDRGMPGHPLEKEIHAQESQELNEKTQDDENYSYELQNSLLPTKNNEGPLEPTFLLQIKENRNNCYDNIWTNIDRGMPGNPLEKEIQNQESYELYEKNQDDENYSYELQFDSSSPKPKKSPLEPKYLLQIKENRNNCYDNIWTNIDRGMSGNPLEKEIKNQESYELYEKNQDDENYSYELQFDPSSPIKKSPLEPTYLLQIKENRNNCYDNIWANIDRGMPGNPLEKEINEQESREKDELEADKNTLTESFKKKKKHHQHKKSSSSSSSSSSRSSSSASSERPIKDEGVFMQLEINEDSSSSSSSEVHPPSRPNNSPRTPKKFFSTYDPKIFYPSTDQKRGTPPKIVHNKVKHPVKLRVTLKDIGLDGMDSVVPGKAAEIFRQEKMKKKNERIVVPNQTSPPIQYRTSRRGDESPKSDTKKDKFVDYSSDESYDVFNVDLNDIDVDDSPPPSPKKDEEKEQENIKDKFEKKKKMMGLRVAEPEARKNDDVDGKRSPRRKKKNEEVKSTYDPSIFYTPFNLSSPSVQSPRAKFDSGRKKYPIKLTVTLKEIGLEGLDSAVPSKSQNQARARKH